MTIFRVMKFQMFDNKKFEYFCYRNDLTSRAIKQYLYVKRDFFEVTLLIGMVSQENKFSSSE